MASKTRNVLIMLPGTSYLLQNDFKNRHGERLHGNVYLPYPGKTFPVLLHRTDMKLHLFDFFYRQITALGIAVYAQNVRGLHGSEGEFSPYIHEEEDGIDSIQWLMNQSWCNGIIGAFGIGYSAQVLHPLLSSQCPVHLSTMILAESSGNLFQDGFRMNGLPNISWIQQAYQWAAGTLHIKNDLLPSQDELLQEGTIVTCHYSENGFRSGTTSLCHYPKIESWLCQLLQTAEESSRESLPAFGLLNISQGCSDIPVLIIDYWHSMTCNSSLVAYSELSSHFTSPVKMLLTPFSIFSDLISPESSSHISGDVHITIPPGNKDKELTTLLNWLCRYLLTNSIAAITNERGIDYFQHGTTCRHHGTLINQGGKYDSSLNWPPAKFQRYYFFLSSNHELSMQKNPMEEAYEILSSYSPSQNFSSSGSSIKAEGGFWQQNFHPEANNHTLFPLTYRKDVISFTTGQIKRTISISGEPELSLSATFSIPTATIGIILMDVLPDGTAVSFSYGSVQWSASGSSQTEYDFHRFPQEIVRIKFRLSPITYTIGIGHRLRLCLTPVLSPWFASANHSGIPPDTSMQSCKIHFCSHHQSALSLLIEEIPN